LKADLRNNHYFVDQPKTTKMRKSNYLFLFIIGLFLCTACSQKADPVRQWSMYRGNYASGVLDHAHLPDTWDADSGENIAWKTEIPGLGHSCPVVWGDNVFVNTAVSSVDKGDIKTGIYGSIGSVQDT